MGFVQGRVLRTVGLLRAIAAGGVLLLRESLLWCSS